ncbi:MAG: tetratricopeptide repeat protein, partial [Rhodospirillales bacterium]
MAFNPGFRKPGGLPRSPVEEIRALISAGRLDAADKKLKLLRRTRPRDADLLNMSGVVALQRTDPATAREYFSKAASLAPERQDILHHLGEASRLTGHWDAAATAYRQALAKGATRYTTWRGLGLALLALDDATGAVTALEKASAGNPKDQITLLKLAEAQAGAGDSQRAIATARQALALDPGNSAARNNLGVLLTNGGFPEESVEHLQQATALAPDRPDYRLNLAAACRAAGQMQVAAGHYEQAIRQTDIGAAGLSAYASLLETLNRTQEAEDFAARALVLDPDDAAALLTTAILKRRTKQYQAALDILEPMEGRDDLAYELAASRYFEIGTNLDRLGRYDDAWRAFTRCNEVHDRSDTARPMDRDAFFADIRNARDVFTPDRVRSWPTAVPDDHPAPVFLVGFPRS